MNAPFRQMPNYIPAAEGGTPVRPREKGLVFGAPVLGEAEISAVADCLRSGWIGLGERVARFEQTFARYKGADYAAAVSSGTAALHLTLLAMGIGPGDEVLAPTMTFCATVNAILHTGATPVLVDCRRTTFNLDPEDLERRITPRTRALIVVHMCGRCCEMDEILDIARRHGLRVIEDCAHAIESEHELGCRLLDLGGAGRPDEPYGVRDFKAKYGGLLVDFGRDIWVRSPARMRVATTGYESIRRFL